MASTYNLEVCYGVSEKAETLPITNLPTDTISVKRRIRANDMWQAFVRTGRGTFQYYLERDGTALKLSDFYIGANIRQ